MRVDTSQGKLSDLLATGQWYSVVFAAKHHCPAANKIIEPVQPKSLNFYKQTMLGWE